MAAVEIEALKKGAELVGFGPAKDSGPDQCLGSAPDASELVASVEQLSKLQVSIEAVDRAIKDEGGLAPGSVGLPSATRG